MKRRSCDAAAEARGHGRVDESTILDALSPLLRSEVCIERCRRVIRASPFLNGTLVRSDIARAVAPFLSPLSVVEGEAVLEKNEPALEMYFVETGCVRLIRDEPVAALEAGSYFGEIPFVFENVMLQPFGAVACEMCDLWVLPRDAFERLGVVFPELPRIVRLVARQRLERMGVSLCRHLVGRRRVGRGSLARGSSRRRTFACWRSGCCPPSRRRRCRRLCRRGVVCCCCLCCGR